MAHIASYINCKYFNDCKNCPHICPHEHNVTSTECLTCPTHCPCCEGPKYGFCNQCSEDNCDNRKAQYNPTLSINKEE